MRGTCPSKLCMYFDYNKHMYIQVGMNQMTLKSYAKDVIQKYCWMDSGLEVQRGTLSICLMWMCFFFLTTFRNTIQAYQRLGLYIPQSSSLQSREGYVSCVFSCIYTYQCTCIHTFPPSPPLAIRSCKSYLKMQQFSYMLLQYQFVYNS